jgi:DNA modification methylase
MKEVRHADYLDFLAVRGWIMVDEKRIALRGPREVNAVGPSPDYEGESTTVWSFPTRGSWATHDGAYRGNWSPFIPRNLIQRYTTTGDWIVDPMMGSGTTLVEAKLLERNAIGIDINSEAVMLARDRIAFDPPPGRPPFQSEIRTYVGDARRLDNLRDETVDLVAIHPPYGSMIRYSRGKVEGDLSDLLLSDYLSSMSEVALECYRVLKRNRCCAILIGDTRRHRHYVPISQSVLQVFMDAGFLLLEEIIKVQHNTSSERFRWREEFYDFHKIAHEHLFVLRKARNEAEFQELAFRTFRRELGP